MCYILKILLWQKTTSGSKTFYWHRLNVSDHQKLFGRVGKNKSAYQNFLDALSKNFYTSFKKFPGGKIF
jgi:hypothetical protein